MGKPKSVRRIIKNAKMGRPEYMYRLGICYETGSGLPQNIQYAVYWMIAAAEEGYAPAKAWIDDYQYDDDAAAQAES